MAFLKLIRIENLLIVVFTQYLIRYIVIDSLLYYKGQKMALMLDNLHFFLLVLSTLFIAAAGYIINDYFDIRTDKINRPGTVVIDKYIKRRHAMVYHILANTLGVGIGLYIAIYIGNYKLALIHIISAGLLWNYSTTFKKQLIIGNVVVSVLTAFVPLIVIIFDMPLIVEYYRTSWPEEAEGLSNLYQFIYKYIFIFSGFAFLTSFIREIIKDMEDYEGDKETGCNTIPIYWGIRTAKAIVFGLISNTIILLAIIAYRFYKTPQDSLPTLYLVIGLILPLLFLAYQLYKAKIAEDFRKASFLVKIIMLIGVSFSFIIFYLSQHDAH